MRGKLTGADVVGESTRMVCLAHRTSRSLNSVFCMQWAQETRGWENEQENELVIRTQMCHPVHSRY